ncbi:hypothetical protein [Moorena producens]|uniref:hypothetical protein n=1 Tax=Moorena producens TaxID=1155739 RepID=UPI003C742ACF
MDTHWIPKITQRLIGTLVFHCRKTDAIAFSGSFASSRSVTKGRSRSVPCGKSCL